MKRYLAAIQRKDYDTLTSLMPSMEPVSITDKLHPWARNPETLGALAGVQMAIMPDSSNKPVVADIKAKLGKVGAVAEYVKFVRSKLPDRVDIGIVALSTLTSECPENNRILIKADSVPVWMSNLSSGPIGTRIAVGTILRNMCVEGGRDFTRNFVAKGGIDILVKQLDIDSTKETESSIDDMRLEAIMNLHDILEDASGSVIPEFSQLAIQAGIRSQLTKCLSSSDTDVKESAQDLLNALEE